MLSNITPDRNARSFCRTQPFAFLDLEGTGTSDLLRVHVALSRSGNILIGTQSSYHMKSLQTGRLYFDEDVSSLSLQGLIGPSGFSQPDERRFQALHPLKELRWQLEPDIAIWNPLQGEPHAFLNSEWFSPHGLSHEEETRFIAHLNDVHQETLVALLLHYANISSRRPLLIAIDSEGLLFRISQKLVFIHFEHLALTAEDVDSEIMRLVSNLDLSGTHALSLN